MGERAEGPENETSSPRAEQPAGSAPSLRDSPDLDDMPAAAGSIPGLGTYSFGTSWERRLQTVAVFTMSLYFIIPLGFSCVIATAVLLLNPLTGPFMMGYLCWMRFLDKSPATASRKPILRGRGSNGTWWRRYCDFFPITLVKTADLDPDGKYVFGYHPHGIISIGAFGAFATEGALTIDLTAPGKDPGRGFSSLFPGLERRLITLPVNFLIPFVREYFLSMGVVNSSAQTFRSVLSRGSGSSVVVVVGGAEESAMVRPGEIELVLEKRKGFVREAILGGASLVPVIAFGENDLYYTMHLESSHWICKFQEFFKKRMGFAIPLFRGRSILLKDSGLMPHRKPVTVVVGSAISPPPMTEEKRQHFRPEVDTKTNSPLNEDARILFDVHSQYVEALVKLYQEHKDSTWNTPGLTRVGTLKISK